MGLLENINYEIEKNGGIGRTYEIISSELYVVKPIKKAIKSPMRYPFTTKYLIQNANIKSRSQLAKALGVSKSHITRRLQELGIEKQRVFSKYQNHIQEACLIINIESGIYYPNCSEAARALNYDLRTVQMYVKERGYYKKFIKVA